MEGQRIMNAALDQDGPLSRGHRSDENGPAGAGLRQVPPWPGNTPAKECGRKGNTLWLHAGE